MDGPDPNHEWTWPNPGMNLAQPNPWMDMTRPNPTQSNQPTDGPNPTQPMDGLDPTHWWTWPDPAQPADRPDPPQPTDGPYKTGPNPRMDRTQVDLCSRFYVVSSTPGEALLCRNLGQVVHTLVHLSPSSIIWYRRKDGDVLWLGRWPRAGRIVLAAAVVIMTKTMTTYCLPQLRLLWSY